jgi:osmoprotectant transport system substrate-binding protein
MRRVLLAAVAGLCLAGCGGSGRSSGGALPAPGPQPGATTETSTAPLPGSERPPVTIGDKNFTEQFILGELYAKALGAEGYSVQLTENIGSTQVTLAALANGRLDMYPEYLGYWDAAVAGQHRRFRDEARALAAGRAYAARSGLELLSPTPFSDTSAVVTGDAYAASAHLHSIADLRRISGSFVFGGAPQFAVDPTGLPMLERAYRFVPARFQALAVGEQYVALDAGTAQVVSGQTTDGALATGGYRILSDPRGVFGYGQAVPVVPTRVLVAEGPAFASTIDAVSRLLTLPVMRQLNAAVDLYNQDPATVAELFLRSHGLLSTPPGSLGGS